MHKYLSHGPIIFLLNLFYQLVKTKSGRRCKAAATSFAFSMSPIYLSGWWPLLYISLSEFSLSLSLSLLWIYVFEPKPRTRCFCQIPAIRLGGFKTVALGPSPLPEASAGWPNLDQFAPSAKYSGVFSLLAISIEVMRSSLRSYPHQKSGKAYWKLFWCPLKFFRAQTTSTSQFPAECESEVAAAVARIEFSFAFPFPCPAFPGPGFT